MGERHFAKWLVGLILVPGLSMDCPWGEALCKMACWTNPGPWIIHGLSMGERHFANGLSD